MTRRTVPSTLLLLLALLLAQALPLHAQSTTPVPITLITWNIGLDDADIDVITATIAAFSDVDLWTLQETRGSDLISDQLAAAAEVGENADFRAVRGASGLDIPLTTIYNADRFTLVDSYELDPINTTGNARAPLVLHLRETATGVEFLLVNNHLYRSREDERDRQATLLNQWAATQTLPLIAAGDHNFDYDVPDGPSAADRGFANMTADGVWAWARPLVLQPTQCSGALPCTYDDILDFVFTANAATDWLAFSEVIVRRGDFPDDENKSDHRPVLAVFDPSFAPVGLAVAPQAPSAVPAAVASTAATAARNANLRAGPGTTFAVVGGVKQGDALDIVGANPAGDWLQLATGAWIAAFLVTSAPDVAVRAAPIVALPTPAPTPARSPTPVPQPLPTVAPRVQEVGNCDPSYPDVCIPPAPPDLDCGDISYRRFRVIGADPHNFDGNHDGVGCEGS